MAGRQNPVVSVVIPTYNRARYLACAVQSVVRQTYQDWELIIVDDGSTDGTRAYFDGLADPRVTTLLRAHSGNPARVRNEGIARSRGRYVAFLDSDDLWSERKLESQLAEMAHSGAPWSYTRYGTIDGDGREIPLPAGGPWQSYSGWILDALVATRAAIATPTVMVASDFLRAVGAFDESMVFSEDYELWLRLAARAPVCAVDALLAWARHGPWRRTTNQPEAHRWKVRAYTKLMETVRDRAIVSACRRQCAAHLAALANHHSTSGHHAQAARSLIEAGHDSFLHADVWVVALKCCLRPIVPPLARRIGRNWVDRIARRT